MRCLAIPWGHKEIKLGFFSAWLELDLWGLFILLTEVEQEEKNLPSKGEKQVDKFLIVHIA